MGQTVVVRGRYANRTFIADGPLPDAQGAAELIISPVPTQNHGSVADAFGAAPVLRTADDILAQVRADRDEWGDR